MAKGRLPDFVIIGAMKCGTTSLHAMLDRHPDIFMSREKEITFFNRARNWERGSNWYRSHFRTSARLCGEASPPYTDWPRHPEVPERMRSLIPDAKLIYCVRDPVARTLSHYKHRIADKGIHEPAETAVFNEKFVMPSRYLTQVERYLGAGFPLEQIHIVQAEALRRDPATVLQGIAKFLGVSFRPPMAHAPMLHETDVKRVPTPRGAALRRAMKPTLAHLPWSVRGGVDALVVRPFSQPMPTIRLPDTVRADLATMLRPEAEGLRAVTGATLPGWSV